MMQISDIWHLWKGCDPQVARRNSDKWVPFPGSCTCFSRRSPVSSGFHRRPPSAQRPPCRQTHLSPQTSFPLHCALPADRHTCFPFILFRMGLRKKKHLKYLSHVWRHSPFQFRGPPMRELEKSHAPFCFAECCHSTGLANVIPYSQRGPWKAH